MGEGRIPEYRFNGTPCNPIIPALWKLAIPPSFTTAEARAKLRDKAKEPFHAAGEEVSGDSDVGGGL
jgi:hypothetical protein